MKVHKYKNEDYLFVNEQQGCVLYRKRDGNKYLIQEDKNITEITKVSEWHEKTKKIKQK